MRKALKVRTAFNLLGPMLNPADAHYGLVGVYSTSVSHLMADALQVRMHWGARGWSVGCWGSSMPAPAARDCKLLACLLAPWSHFLLTCASHPGFAPPAAAGCEEGAGGALHGPG